MVDRRIERCLVVAPASLTVQWLGELWRKYHQVFTLLDERRLADVERDFGAGFNPFELHRREATVMAQLPTTVQAPRLLDALHTTVDGDDWVALVLDDEPTVLWLISGNERARRFYERRGFVPWGEEVSTGESWNHVPMRRMLRAQAPERRG